MLSLFSLSLSTSSEGADVRLNSIQLGMEVHRAESLNDSPVFIRAIADIAAAHLRDTASGQIGPTSVQMGLRCPGCTNATCGQQKQWFARGGDA